jgi:hypothetical protein
VALLRWMAIRRRRAQELSETPYIVCEDTFQVVAEPFSETRKH